MENKEKADNSVEEHTEIIQEKIRNIPSNRPAAFDFSDFFDKNRKIITYGGGGLLILILAVGYYFYSNSGKEQEAKNAIFRAQRYYEVDSLNLALKGDGTELGEGMTQVADDYGSTKTGDLAYYYIGMAKLKQGKYQDAIDNLEKFDLKDAIVYPEALGGIGDAYSQLKDYESAAKYYNKAADADDNQFTTPRYSKKAALVYEKLGEYKKALDLYTHIKEKYKNTPEVMDIDKYIARAKAENGGKD